ncbi:hypothetical protein PanWU01x14_146260, partial [Parasponia andersonii]
PIKLNSPMKNHNETKRTSHEENSYYGFFQTITLFFFLLHNCNLLNFEPSRLNCGLLNLEVVDETSAPGCVDIKVVEEEADCEVSFVAVVGGGFVVDGGGAAHTGITDLI